MPRTTRRPEGNIEELPSGRFRVRVSAGNDPITGRPRYLREVVATKAEAKAASIRLRNQVNENRHARSDLTVSQLIDKWLAATQHEASTRQRYEQIIRLYIAPTLGKENAGKVDAEILELLYARLLRCRELCGPKTPRTHTCSPLAPNTVRKVHFVLRAAFETAVRYNYLGVNVAAMCRPPAFARSEPDPPTAEEAAALLNEASRDPEWALMLWLTMTLGWRRGELCALRWSDVDLDSGVIAVERSLWERTEKSTKTHQGRRVAIDEHAVSALREHLARSVDDAAKLEVSLNARAFVFSPAPDHSVAYVPRSLSHRYRRLARTVGLRSTRLHALRHYSASQLISSGADVRTVAGRLGHGSGGATTLKVYAAWSGEADRKAAATIGGIVPRPDPSKRIVRHAHERLAGSLRAAIQAGRYPAGQRLPSLAELAAEHHLAPNTVSRALAALKSEGLVEISRGQRPLVLAPIRGEDLAEAHAAGD